MNHDDKLINKILNMSFIQRLEYFESLSKNEKQTLQLLLEHKTVPKKLCDLRDDSASFTDWIISHFYVPELNGPIWLAPYQIDALNKATSKNKDGLYNYSLILWMDIKKSIKSCIAAAVALRMAFMRNWASIKVVANKRDQAASRSYFYITRSLKLNPETNTMLQNSDIKINNYKIEFKFNNASIQALPLNPEGEAGGNDDLIIWTEAWAAKTKAAQTMFTEMVIPPNKFGKGFKWIESYAGYSGDSPILERLYKENVENGNKLNDIMYANGQTFALYNTIPRLPWQTKEYYAQQAKELTESEFNRVHRNMWQSSTNKFVENLQWDLCKRKIPPLKRKEKLLLALDVGLQNDCFAIVGVNKINGKTAVRTVRVWKPKKGQKLHFSNPNPRDKKNDANYPFGYIQKLCKEYRVIALHYDPHQAEKLAEDLERERIINCEPFSQLSLRTKADKYLQDIIREQEIIHSDHPVLTQHIYNAQAQQKGENKLRMVKSNDTKKIDAAVALAMAAYSIKDYR